MVAVKESLTKASKTSSLLLSDLKAAHQKADPIEEIVVRGILRDAVELGRKLKELSSAVSAKP